MGIPVVTVVGGGLAGSEAALQLARRGVRVRLHEMRPVRTTGAHRSARLAELVCSNSLKSTNPTSAQGLLKEELDRLGSQLLAIARECAVGAGGALAVDRDRFARRVSEVVAAHPLIELRREEVTEVPEGPAIIATGPLTSDALARDLALRLGARSLAFFDAAAPIVDATTIDRERVFAQNRYDRGEGAYLNCPFDREGYERFVDELVGAERVVPREFETKELFRACQPVEEVARTGRDALRFGALKPVGLTDPATGARPWAVVQLRAENAQGSAYNLVGFQTNLTFGEQRRVFRMIPGLERAEFFRYGVMHRNSFVDAPHVLGRQFQVPGCDVWLAGQLTGTEGYVEAIASGLLAALNAYSHLTGAEPVSLPATGSLGSLVAYATDPAVEDYQPMHVNFGLQPALEHRPRKKRERYAAYARRALDDLDRWMARRPDLWVVGP